MEEQTKEFESSFTQESLEESELRPQLILSNSQILEEQTEGQRETDKEISKEIEKTKDVPDQLLRDDFELSKTKVKDNLSEICKKNTENIIKCKVKADVTVQCLVKKSQANMEERSNLEKFKSECELQGKYFQNQVNLRKKDRAEIENEMQTVDAIISITNERISSQETDVCKYELELLKCNNYTEEILNEFQLLKETEERIDSNQVLIEKSKAELGAKRNEIIKNHEEYINQRMCLEQNIENLQEQLMTVKRRNEELLTIKNQVHLQQINDRKQELFELKEQLNSIDLEQAENELNNLKTDSEARICAENKEIDILSQRLVGREDYLKELKDKLDILQKNNFNSVESRNDLANEVAQNKIISEELNKKRDENQQKFKEELDRLKNNKMELERNFQELETEITGTVQNVNQLRMQLNVLQTQLSEENSLSTSLSVRENELENELQALANIYQTHQLEKSSLEEDSRRVENNIEQLNAEKAFLQEKLEGLRTTFSTEISQLEKELVFLEEAEKECDANEIEFENAKVVDLEELRKSKDDNEAKLNEVREKLENLKNTQISLHATIEDLNIKLKTKTERRDALRNQFKQLQENIDHLEKDVQNLQNSEKDPTTSTLEVDALQKPVSILKTSKIKSPQKKVTFDKNLNWDTLSESSTDAFFDNILKSKNPSQTGKKTVTSNDMFDMLRRNSPPERESSKKSDLNFF